MLPTTTLTTQLSVRTCEKTAGCDFTAELCDQPVHILYNFYRHIFIATLLFSGGRESGSGGGGSGGGWGGGVGEFDQRHVQ